MTRRQGVLMAASIRDRVDGVLPTDHLVFMDLEGAEQNYISSVAVIVCDCFGRGFLHLAEALDA